MHKKINYQDFTILYQKKMARSRYQFHIEAIKKEWKNIVGELLCFHSVPVRIMKKNLIIACENSSYENEITKYKDHILKNIQNSVYFIKSISISNTKDYWRHNHYTKENLSKAKVPKKINEQQNHPNNTILKKLIEQISKI